MFDEVFVIIQRQNSTALVDFSFFKLLFENRRGVLVHGRDSVSLFDNVLDVVNELGDFVVFAVLVPSKC